MLKVAILAVPNCIHSSVTGPLDIFSVASLHQRQLGPDSAPFCEVGIVRTGQDNVFAFNGLEILPTMTAEPADRYDIILLPAIYGDLRPALNDRRLLEWLVRQHAAGTCICTVCAGSFLAAEAGLLRGRRATTHWALAADFRRRYPDVVLKAERMLVDEGDVVSAGGITSYLDLCLHLLRRFGSPELAAAIARTFLLDTGRREQLPYAVGMLTKNHGDAEILRVQQWLDDHFRGPVTVPDMARAAGLGERTFARRFSRATGDSPSTYLQGLRIEASRQLLEHTRETVEVITRKVGYEDVASFRRLFRKQTGLSPTAYRRRFGVPDAELSA